VKDSEWDGIRRKYWHGRDTYYLPIVTWNNNHLVKQHFQNAQAGVANNDKRNYDTGFDQDDSKKMKT